MGKVISFIKRLVRFLLNNLRKEVVVHIDTPILPSNQLLKDRVALVTGGGSGIGKAIASSFLKSGAYVILAGRHVEKLEKAREELGFPDRTFNIKLDTTKISEMKDRLDKLVGNEKFGKISILVNNAGVSGGELATATEEEFDRIIDTNVKGTFFISKYFGAYFKNNQIKGNILNIASSSSLRPATSAYNISKWGIRGFTLGLARLLAPYGVTVNGIAPGPTATPMMLKEGSQNMYKPNSLIKRWIMPEEIANMAVFLVSEMGRSIVGDIVYMTGGAGNVSNEDISYYF